jgi:acyl-coenzyme A synthetase/AMP-(fatty) acid ligase
MGSWKTPRGGCDALPAVGVRPGDHVALSCENRIELPALYWGCVYAGTYFTWLGSAEVDHVLRDSDARVLIGTNATRDAMTSAPAAEQPFGGFRSSGVGVGSGCRARRVLEQQVIHRRKPAAAAGMGTR